MARHLAILMAACHALGLPAVAWAGGREELSAEELYERATEAYLSGRFLEAARDYALAYDEVGAGELAYNTARAFDRGGRWDDAERYYQRWLDDTPPVKERERLADKLLQAGREAKEQGNTDIALRRLTFALRLRLVPDPELTFELGELHAASGHANLAREMYRKALAEGYPDTEALEAALLQLERASTIGRVVLRGEATGIEVLVDGQALPGVDTGAPFELAEGAHRIEVRKPDHRPWRARVIVRAGKTTAVRFNLVPRPAYGAAPPPPPDVGLAVRPPPRPGMGRGAGDRPPWLPPAWSLVSFGASGAGLVAGLIFGSFASGAEEQLDDCVGELECSTSHVATELSERVGTRTLQANLSFVVAGVAAGAGLWLWIDDQMDSQPEPEDELDDLTAGTPTWRGGATWTF